MDSIFYDPKDVSSWRRNYSLLILVLTFFLPASGFWVLISEEKPSSIDKIWENIYAQDYTSAKKLIQKDLKGGKEESLPLLSLMEVCLNGLERYKQADEQRKKILSIWEKTHKKAFLEENYPLNLATWTRMVVVTPNILLLGAEYYLPYPVNAKKEGFYYHKFTAYNRFSRKASHFFKLEKSPSTDQEYRLFEIKDDGQSNLVKNYGDSLPDLRDEMKDIQKFLKLQ